MESWDMVVIPMTLIRERFCSWAPGRCLLRPQRKRLKSVRATRGGPLCSTPTCFGAPHLGDAMGQYTFFSYKVNEALHVSEKERLYITEVVNQIKEEYRQNIDRHSQRLIISNLELLLNYCTRFYDRPILYPYQLQQGLCCVIRNNAERLLPRRPHPWKRGFRQHGILVKRWEYVPQLLE